MGCVSSTFLPDDDRRIIGVSATTHIVSLTSSTYGILTTLGADAEPHKSAPPPPPPPPPPKTEVINSWELMAGLVDPSTPAKSPRARSKRLPLRAIDGNQAQTRRCPPGGAQSAVLYTTSLRGVRPTFEACNAVRAALQSHGVAFRERDVSMDRGFREELRGLVQGGGGSVPVPRLFVRGRQVGGAEEVLRLEEEGALAALLEGLPRARGGRCDGCGGMRFLPCFQCSGSRKLVIAVGKGGGGAVVRCGDCNENGLVLCPICS